MYKGKKFLAVIPARGGSKGIPKKNIKPLCGKPLIAWTIEQALHSQLLDKVIVSTDDETIAHISKKWGAQVPFLRPKELATDEAPTFGAIQHAIDFFAKQGEVFDYVAILEPTSPLREKDDIDIMIKKLVNNGCDSIISIGEVQHHPSLLFRIKKDRLMPFRSDFHPLRRQELEPLFFPFGVAYIVNVDRYLYSQTLYCDNMTYHKIKRYQCYEIDDIYDFITIESIMRYEWRLT